MLYIRSLILVILLVISTFSYYDFYEDENTILITTRDTTYDSTVKMIEMWGHPGTTVKMTLDYNIPGRSVTRGFPTTWKILHEGGGARLEMFNYGVKVDLIVEPTFKYYAAIYINDGVIHLHVNDTSTVYNIDQEKGVVCHNEFNDVTVYDYALLEAKLSNSYKSHEELTEYYYEISTIVSVAPRSSISFPQVYQSSSSFSLNGRLLKGGMEQRIFIRNGNIRLKVK